MTDIAAAVLCVGLCFYNLWRWKSRGDVDELAALIALLAALKVLI